MEMGMSEDKAPGEGAGDPLMAALSDEEFAETALEVRSKERLPRTGWTRWCGRCWS
jgi:hypothetical protein